jgi:hypothetical protein
MSGGVARRLILALLECVPGLSWLDAQKEWFTIADAKRNRLANIVRKILCVSPDISLSEMRGAIHRVHRLAGFSPPRAILREFCKSLSFCRVGIAPVDVELGKEALPALSD